MISVEAGGGGAGRCVRDAVEKTAGYGYRGAQQLGVDDEAVVPDGQVTRDQKAMAGTTETAGGKERTG